MWIPAGVVFTLLGLALVLAWAVARGVPPAIGTIRRLTPRALRTRSGNAICDSSSRQNASKRAVVAAVGKAFTVGRIARDADLHVERFSWIVTGPPAQAVVRLRSLDGPAADAGRQPFTIG